MRRHVLCGLLCVASCFASLLPTWLSSAIADEFRREDFHLKINMFNTDLPQKTLEPKPNTVTNRLQGMERNQDLRIYSRAKPMSGRSGFLQVEIYIENLNNYPLDDIEFELSQLNTANQFFNVTQDAYNQEPMSVPGKIKVGRLTSFGVKRIILAVKKGVSPDLKGSVSFREGEGEGQISTNILVSPDGQELWSVSSDTDEVIVFSLPSKQELARIPVGKTPFGLAIQKQLNWIVVSSTGGNAITLIDRNTKQVINVLGQNEEFGRELRYLLVSQKSPKIYVSSYVEGIISEIVLDSNGNFVSSQSIEIGPRPSGMSMTYDESFIYAAHFLPRGPIRNNESWISVIDLQAFAKHGEGIVEDHFNPGNERMECLADFYSSYLPTKLVFNKVTNEDVSFEGVASQLAGAFLDPSGQVAWIPGTRVTGALVVLEKGENADPNLQRFGGLELGQYVAPLIFPFDASEKSKLHEIFVNDFEMAIPTLGQVTKCMRHPLEIEFIDRALRNNGKEQTNPFLAYAVPQGSLSGLGLVNTIQFTQGGRLALMLSHISDEIAIYDATTYHPASQLHFQLSGSNPKGMAISPDYKNAYVLYENSLYISELDLSAYAGDNADELPKPNQVPYYYRPSPTNPIQLGSVPSFPLIRNIENVPLRPAIKEVTQIQLAKNDPLSPEMRRGKILFASANPDKYKVSLNRLGACASCHPDGGSDGSSWVTMEGSRRTLSLRGGVADRGWLHISATHEDIREFVDIVVPERLGGKLPAEDLDAMALYVGEGIPKLQSPRVDEEKANKGKQLFATYCQGCHNGPAYTSGTLPNHEPVTFKLGTGNPNHSVGVGRFFSTAIGISDPLSKEIMELLAGDRPLGPGDRVQEILDYRQRPARDFGEFKAPSLVNTFDYSVYFHDGSIDNLNDAIKKIDEVLGFGLKQDEVDALEAFLKTL